MAKKTSAVKSPINSALAAGAEEIRKAKEAAAGKPDGKKADAKTGGKKAAAKKAPAAAAVVVPPTPQEVLGKKWAPSDRPIDEILSERVTMAEGNTGAIIADGTPLEECIPILDYFQKMGDHVGFFIGDTLVAMETQHPGKYEAALAITGRALSTLKSYQTTARAIPIEKRQEALSFTTHREVARIKNLDIKAKLLADAAKQVEQGQSVTSKEMRARAVKAEPPVKTRPAKGKGKKSGKKDKPAKPVHTLSPDEQAIHDDLLAKIDEIDAIVTSKEGKSYLASLVKTPNTVKRVFNAKLNNLQWFAAQVFKATGNRD